MSFNKYPYTDFHEMNDDWVIAKVKELIAAWSEVKADWTQVQSDWTDEQQAFQDLKDFVNTYFDELDVQTEINTKLDAMAADGTLGDLIEPYVTAKVTDQLPGEVSSWLSEHVDPDTGYVIDDTLTIADAAADAKATGDAIAAILTEKDLINEIVSDEAPILTDLISDTTTTINGVSYTLSANTLTVANTATGNSAFPWLATTTLPQSLRAGSKYIVDLKVSAVISGTVSVFAIYGKSTSDPNLHIVQEFNKSGTYLIELPSDLTHIRFVTIVYSGATLTGTVTAQISNAIPAFGKNNLVQISGADANNITRSGYYVWGSGDNAANVPYSAGMLMHFYRDNNTKYQIAISYFDGGLYERQCKSGSWEAWKRITDKPNLIKYEQGSYYYGKATERLSIYLPASSGYIMYRLYHFEDTDNNCDGWQIFSVSTANDSLGNAQEFTVTGEWECAIHLDGRDDFSGGHTHGDEIMTDFTVLLDGNPVDITTLTSNTVFHNLQIIQTSFLYDPDDHTTEIADHGKEYIFNDRKLTLNQSLKWKVAEDLTNCFLAMFLPMKTAVNRAYANNDFNVLTLESDDYSITKNDATAVTMFHSAGGISADVSVPIYPEGLPGGDLALLTDNGGLSYNKLYFKVCGSGSSSIGELWKSQTVYKIDYKN